MKKYLSKFFILSVGCQLIAFSYLKAQTGTWTKVATNAPTANLGVALLLTDGTVICHNSAGGTYGTGWNKLTPSATGSYVNGTWSTIASMNYPRLFFSAQVLPSGNVYVAGGEYGTGGTHGEVYNPVTNTWAVCGNIPSGWNLYDAPSELLYTGNVLEGPEIGASGSQPCNSILQWSPTTLNYTTETKEPENHDEAQWIKLPDSSVLTIGMPYPSFPSNDSSCRFLPKTNTWLVDAQTPNNIYDEYGFESGPGFLLPNGKAIFFGATKYNVIYTPTGYPTVGSWASAANFPTIRGSQVGQTDAPGAMMVNGHIFLAVSPAGTRTNEAQDPIYFLEYNYTTNTFTQVTSPITGIGGDSIPNNSCFQCQMLDLPDGTVLVSISQSTTYSKDYWVYTPGSAAIPQGKPTINSILPDGCPNYKVTGKLFNGISEGAAYGDDWQMATNFPLVRLTNGTNVYYARTTNWNRVGAVQTDSLEDTVVFTPPTLPAGTYSLVVVANGFASNPTLFSVFGASISSQTNASCGSTGSVTITASGGLVPYSYSWTPGGASNATASGLSAGSYTVTVKDNNGCSVTATVTITQSGGFSVSANTTTNESCNGSSTGSASATSSGGTLPYTYVWSPVGGSSSTASGLSAGTYTISVTDNGCTVTAAITITQPLSISITTSVTAVSCNDGSNGIISLSPSGGTSPYTYSWSGGGTNSSKTGLSAGTYSVTLTDKNGCTLTSSSIITQPTFLSVSAITTINNTSCSGGNGSISSTPSGGTSPYTFSWSGGSTNSTETGLSAGTYTITLKDRNGCLTTASTVVTQSSSLGISASTTGNINCNGGTNGSVSASVSGGTSPYTYSWTGGGNNINETGLSAGTYTISLKDNNGCSASASTIITQPNLLSVSASTIVNNTSCSGENNGSISASVSGGTSPYTYSWTGGSSTSNESGLSAATYTITVKDNNGCTATSSTTVTQSVTLNVSAVTTNNISCNGGNNGSVSAISSGGTSPYTYSWSGGGFNSTETGLSAGTYTITLKDNNGCSAIAVTTVTQPPSLSASASVTANISCNGGNNGSVSASPSGGTLPYTYSWSGGGSSSTASGLSTGTYTITLKDNNGCTATASTTITQPALLSVSANTTANTICNGDNNGSVSAATTGGTSPYTYSWTGGGSNSTETGLSAGTFTITLTDKNGCSATALTTITQSSSLILSATTTSNISCNGGNNGSISSNLSGGVSPYTYSWTPNGGSSSTASDLGAGTYTITVSDNNGCSATASAIITQPSSSLGITISLVANIYCNGGTGSATAYSATGGTSPYTYSWTPAGGTNLSTIAVTAGTYTITVTDNNGCTGIASATITQPQALGIIISSITNVNCHGGSGIIVANAATGGTLPYTYAWSPSGGTNLTATVSAGTYTITVIDNNGCFSQASASITQPATALGISISSVSNIICGGSGSISASTASGGSSPYSYSWSPSGGSTTTASNLSTGTYTIITTDGHGCTATASATITQSATLAVSANTTANISCNGGNNGSVSSTPTGGTSPYTYSWSDGGSNSTETGLSIGTYSITITDNNGCITIASTTVTQPNLLSVSANTTTNVTCGGGSNGQASASVTGGTLPYTYSWSPYGGTSNIAAGLSAGIYSVTVTDNNGCINSSEVTITQSASIRDSISSHTNPVCPATTGSATVGIKGGILPYTYSWSPISNSTATASGLSVGTYTVTTTDASLCSATTSVTITQTGGLTVTTIVSNNVSCNGGATGQAKASVGGGSTPYTYSWSPNSSTTYLATGLSAGVYSVTVTGKNGCPTTQTVTITQPAAIRDSVTITYPTCIVATGSATIGVKGGTSPYSYTWSPAVTTTASASGLAIRSYVVTVKDANGCNSVLNFSISQPPILRDSIITASIVYVPCNGASVGSATAGAKFGTPPYTYSWNPNISSTATATGLSTGTYTVTVKDANTCSATASVTITQSAGITATAVVADEVSCNGGTNGQAKVTVTGGASPYTYSWSPNTGTTYLTTGLSAGIYTVTVKDKNGCSGSSTVSVTQPATIRDSISINYPACYGGGGSATIGIKGGTSPYTYTWTPGTSTTATATGLTARSYSVLIKDANGCTSNLAFSITQPLEVHDSIVKASTVNILCNGSGTGSATVGVKYGTSSYTYSWSPNVSSLATASGISAGTYTVTVKDGCGNSATAVVTITQPAAIRDSISSSSCTSGLVTATVGVKGGVLPYTYSWSPGGGTKATITGLSAGTYTITVTDKNGCSITISPTLSCGATIDSPDDNTGSQCCSGTEVVNIYPNPNTGQFTIRLSVESSPSLVEIYNMLGQRVKSEELRMKDNVIDLFSQPSGIYLYRVLKEDGSLIGSGKIIVQK